MDDKRVDFASIVTTSKFLKRQQENEKRNLRSAPALWGVQTSTSWHENELSHSVFCSVSVLLIKFRRERIYHRTYIYRRKSVHRQ